MRLFNSGKTEFNPSGRVLEIACGMNPIPQATVCTDFEPRTIKALKAKGDTRAMLASGFNLPFEDKSFDYVACLHFAEHLEHSEIKKLISEMQRVAPRGYIETPSIYWELLHNADKDFSPEDECDTSHKQYCFLHEGTLHFIRKPEGFNPAHRILWQLFHSVLSGDLMAENIDLFMVGYEWGSIKLEFHKSLDTVPAALMSAIQERIVSYAKNKPKISHTRRYLQYLAKGIKNKLKKYGMEKR